MVLVSGGWLRAVEWRMLGVRVAQGAVRVSGVGKVPTTAES
jgi:hypothetical protein